MAKSNSTYMADMGLTEEQFHEASQKAEDARIRLEAGEELGMELRPALDRLKDFYRGLSCTQPE